MICGNECSLSDGARLRKARWEVWRCHPTLPPCYYNSSKKKLLNLRQALQSGVYSEWVQQDLYIMEYQCILFCDYVLS